MEVWQAIREDRERGAKRLVSEYGNRLFAAAVLLCPNDSDAEELVYKSFDQAIKKIGLYQPKSDFFSWLYVIMLNFRRMDLRKRKAEVIPVGAPCDLPEMCSPSVMAFWSCAIRMPFGRPFAAFRNRCGRWWSCAILRTCPSEKSPAS